MGTSSNLNRSIMGAMFLEGMHYIFHNIKLAINIILSIIFKLCAFENEE